MTKEELIKMFKERITVKAQLDYSGCYYSGDHPDIEFNLYLDGEFLLSCYTNDMCDDICQWYDKEFK
jgi:hypothetical protein